MEVVGRRRHNTHPHQTLDTTQSTALLLVAKQVIDYAEQRQNNALEEYPLEIPSGTTGWSAPRLLWVQCRTSPDASGGRMTACASGDIACTSAAGPAERMMSSSVIPRQVPDHRLQISTLGNSPG